MSDDTKNLIDDEELDKISGGVMSSHPFPRDPIRPPVPPTHPAGGRLDPPNPKHSNPAG